MIKNRLFAAVFSVAAMIPVSSFASNDTPEQNKLDNITYIPFIANSVQYEEKDNKSTLSFFNVCKVNTPLAPCDKVSKKVNVEKIARYMYIRMQDKIPVSISVKLPHKDQYHVDCHVDQVDLVGDVLKVQCAEKFASKDFVQLNKAHYNRVIVTSKADPKVGQLMKMTFGE